MSRIVVVGEVMVDIVARLSGPVVVGSDSPASISFAGGGSAANVAAWLGFLGASTTFVGRVGDDSRGASAVAALRASGVDARVTVDAEHSTGTCIVLVDPGGERSMVPDPGANVALAVEDVPDSLLAAGDHLHVTGYSLVRDGPRPAALATIARAAEAGMSVSVDPSSAALLGPEFLDLLDYVRLLLPNAEEATALTGASDAIEAARSLAARFPEVVVKLGAEGAMWTNGSEEERVAALPVDAASGPAGEATASVSLDTTGAGDAFAAGLLAARLRGASEGEALAAGCELAAQAVVTPGARLRPLSEHESAGF